MAARLREHYDNVIKTALQERSSTTRTPWQVPKLDKIVINMGVGEASQDAKKIEGAVADLAAISGQKPVMTKATKSIATFKLRENMPIGCKVTLRSDRMYEFLDRLINIALPRVRDFRGVSPKSFDGRGNYALGLKEQIVFPGNRLRPGRQGARHGHRDRHHRQDRRGSQSAAAGLRHAVHQLRAERR